ncbi:hypothetical protein [Paenarthrobacter nitroguajacolicus]|uniref:hypothetical protein n=1 Tax=Paenarthrobacter nitroguajacolicus TaxID=211146 RepID=UPI00248CDF63|nr:hypothetical protein [Paenarthrobacter nitroguajacolicus]MDI2036810.1 hypothetical protein [Paenarthrobacter nitroguajacolicus]
MEAFVATIMVLLTLIVVATRRQGKDTSILWAAVLISLSLVLNLNHVYIYVDEKFGGRNYTDLGANLLLLVGIYFLARAIHRAASPTPADGSSPRLLGKSSVVLAATLAATFFALIDAPATSTTFMRDYGAQPFAALYSMVQYVYIGSVMATAGYTCLKFRKSWSTGVYTLAFALIGSGCASAVLLVIQVLMLDVLHLLGQLQLMSSLDSLYGALNSATFALLCTGLALPPARRRILGLRDVTETNSVLRTLEPVWAKAIRGNRGVTLDLRVVPDHPEKPRRKLHRMVVEIQDSLARDPSTANRIGTDGMDKLSTAAEFLEGLTCRPK